MTPPRPPLRPIPGNNQKIHKTKSFEERIDQFFKLSLNSVVSDLLSEIDYPFVIPIELYLSVREPTVSLDGFDMKYQPYDSDKTFYSIAFFEPARPEIMALIESSLAEGATALDASFDWAYVGGVQIVPTVYIDVPLGTVNDWADLESRIRALMARMMASKRGIVVDVQFRVKGATADIRLDLV
jgi:hypothetical protein